MQEITLTDIRSFHHAMLTIASAGVPLTIGADSQSQSTLQQRLLDIETRLFIVPDSTVQLDETLAAKCRLPRRYLTALSMWLESPGTPLAFEPLAAGSVAGNRSRNAAKARMVQPLFWVLLAVAVLIYIYFSLIPKVASLSELITREPGPVLSFQLFAAKIAVVLLPGMLVLLLLAFWWIARRGARVTGKSLPSRLAVSRHPRTVDSVYGAAVAECAAELMDNQSIEESREIDAARGRLLSSWLSDSSQDDANQVLPPLLSWSVSASQSDQPIPTSESPLRLAARIYRSLTKLKDESALELSGSTLLVGGLLVLFVGLSAFWPLIELLQTVASGRGGSP